MIIAKVDGENVFSKIIAYGEKYVNIYQTGIVHI